jgi:hypothetical protein
MDPEAGPLNLAQMMVQMMNQMFRQLLPYGVALVQQCLHLVLCVREDVLDVGGELGRGRAFHDVKRNHGNGGQQLTNEHP